MAARIGVMGGTFDPIHLGHLVAAEEVRTTFELSEVIFMPAGSPWMKEHRHLASPDHRREMTRLAIADNPAFSVSRLELDTPGPTHTVDTLRSLHDAGPTVGAELFFITGADALADLPEWAEPEQVLELATFVAVTRPGYDVAAAPHAQHANVRILEIPALAISSSDIRDRVRHSRSIRYLVPESVRTYIEDEGLYLARGA